MVLDNWSIPGTIDGEVRYPTAIERGKAIMAWRLCREPSGNATGGQQTQPVAAATPTIHPDFVQQLQQQQAFIYQ